VWQLCAKGKKKKKKGERKPKQTKRKRKTTKRKGEKPNSQASVGELSNTKKERMMNYSSRQKQLVSEKSNKKRGEKKRSCSCEQSANWRKTEWGCVKCANRTGKNPSPAEKSVKKSGAKPPKTQKTKKAKKQPEQKKTNKQNKEESERKNARACVWNKKKGDSFAFFHSFVVVEAHPFFFSLNRTYTTMVTSF
jgi:hypothetical protein